MDLENRIQSLREDAAFKARLHEQVVSCFCHAMSKYIYIFLNNLFFVKELTETFTHSRVAVEETDTRLQDEYDSRLREALQQIREENEENIRMMRMETEAVFEKKVVFDAFMIYTHWSLLQLESHCTQYGELRAAASQSEGASEKTICEIRSLQRRTEDQADSIGRLKDLVSHYSYALHSFLSR